MNPYQPPVPSGRRHRRCRFRLALVCGHLVTVEVSGWYPVAVPCCDRLGGTVLCGRYVPYSSAVEYVDVVEERYEWRPAESPPEPMQIIERVPRTDTPAALHGVTSAGRSPQHVGSAWSIDGTAT